MGQEAILLGCGAVLGMVAVAWLGEAPPPVGVPAPAAVAAPPAVAPALPAAAAAPAPAPAADRRHQLELPDGTFVAALNGAVDPAPLREYWGPYPWSPIVGVERSEAGVDWYRHENGSYSTTQMVWRSDRQRYLAMTRVAHPGPAAAPTAPPPDPTAGR